MLKVCLLIFPGVVWTG